MARFLQTFIVHLPMKHRPLAQTLPLRLTLLLTPWVSSAVAQTWNNFSNSATQWGTAVNWQPSGAPASSLDTTLFFSSAAGYTTSNNLGGFDLNRMVFTAPGSPAGNVTVTNLTASDTINFKTSTLGAAPAIVQDGSGRVTFRHAVAGSAGITLAGGAAGTTLEFLGSGLGDIYADATVVSTGTGASGLRINQTGGRRFGTGSAVRLGGSGSSFTGGVVLDSGNLMLSSVLGTTGAINLTASVAATSVTSLGSGTLTVNGGTIQFDPASVSSGASPTGITGTLQVNNPILLNSNLNIAGAPAASNVPSGNLIGIFAGDISGAGGINLNPVNGTSLHAFTGSNSFSGVVTAAGVGNTVAAAQVGTADVSAGNFAGASGLVATGNSSISLINVAGLRTRLNAVTPPSLTLNRGNFSLFGHATTDSAETLGQLTVVGMGSVFALNGSASATTTTLTFSSLNRGPDNRGTLSLAGTNLGSGTGAGESVIRLTTNPGGATGGGGGTGTVTRDILPYAVVNSQAKLALMNGLTSPAGTPIAGSSTALGGPVMSLVRWDAGTNRMMPLNQATEYAGSLYLSGSGPASANLRLATTAAQPAGLGAAGLNNPASRPYSINSLTLDTDAAAASQTGVSVAGSGVLKVTGGAILAASSGGASGISLPSQINTGGLDFGAAPGYLHTAANLTVNAPITGSGGVVKSQLGTLVLNGTNTFTGGLFANGGSVQFVSDASLGAAGEKLVLNSGLTTALTFQPGNVLQSGAGSATVNRPVTVGDAGAVISVALANTTLTLPGTISGTGQFAKNGSGVLNLTGTNTYTGNTVAIGGTLRPSSDAALGAPTSAVILVCCLRSS